MNAKFVKFSSLSDLKQQSVTFFEKLEALIILHKGLTVYYGLKSKNERVYEVKK